MSLFASIRLDKKLDARLARLARLTGRSKSYYVNQALEEQLQRLEPAPSSAGSPASRAMVGSV